MTATKEVLTREIVSSSLLGPVRSMAAEVRPDRPVLSNRNVCVVALPAKRLSSDNHILLQQLETDNTKVPSSSNVENECQKTVVKQQRDEKRCGNFTFTEKSGAAAANASGDQVDVVQGLLMLSTKANSMEDDATKHFRLTQQCSSNPNGFLAKFEVQRGATTEAQRLRDEATTAVKAAEWLVQGKERSTSPALSGAAVASLGMPSEGFKIVAPKPSRQEIEACRHNRDKGALFAWYEMLEKLYEFRAQHGHCNVPQKGFGNLGIFVNKQRSLYKFKKAGKRTTLSDRREAELVKIGFCWGRAKGQENWELHYKNLVEFHKEHGHANVPTKNHSDTTLGRWVSSQRCNYKKHLENPNGEAITEDQIAKLNALGFKWTVFSHHQQKDDATAGGRKRQSRAKQDANGAESNNKKRRPTAKKSK